MPVIACPDCGRDVSTLAPMCPHCGRPSPAGNTPMTAPPQPMRERTLWQGTPSPTLLAGHVALIVAVLIGVPLLAHFFGSSLPDPERGQAVIGFGWIATGLLVTIQLIALAVAWMKLRSTMYTISNQRVLIEQGVFSKTVDEIDLRYVDDSQFAQTFVDRILGIGNVTLVSSDKTTPRYVLRSVKDPRAVREIVRAEAYQNSQRQIFTRAT
ncbi:MAG TPA: PH domain-containing protein [Thermoanaerobaculia bacterium]